MKFTVPDMTCGHCVATVTRAIKDLDAAAEVKVDLAAKSLAVETNLPAAVVSKALDDAGYPNAAAG
ncbi:heavy-metal-associated domain-containing protein [Aestuariivirga sp.]|uniref:heavy-metal-associated domain-containing protein n=1 Tax=Aestuariivirga sp. TaxID=2650926 RepID=UPI003BAA8BA8